MNTEQTHKVGILISGWGRGACHLMEDLNKSSNSIETTVVISNGTKGGAFDYCEENGIEYVDLQAVTSKKELEHQIQAIIESKKLDLAVLAGYMKVISRSFLQEVSVPIINIHPSLLPAFKGLNSIQQAMDYPVVYSGLSTHFVTEELDGGKIIDQVAIRIADKSLDELLEEFSQHGRTLLFNSVEKVLLNP